MSDEGDQAHERRSRKARASRAGIELKETEAAFDGMRAAAIRRWSETKDGQTELREGLYRTVQVIDAVRAHLRRLVDDGQVADAEEAAYALLGKPE